MGGIINIIWPQICVVCKDKIDSGKFVCADCWQKIKKNTPPFCHYCGRHLERNNFTKSICNSCLKRQPHFDRAFSPCSYEGVLKELIHAFKYSGKVHLGSVLSGLIVEFIKEYSLPIDFVDFIIPVPLHKSRMREREFNQAQVLSEHIAKEFGKPMLNDALIRHRATRTQTELEDQERHANVKDSFSVKKNHPLKGKNVLLIDDVLTTAATSSEAAYVLKENGAGIVFVLTLAN